MREDVVNENHQLKAKRADKLIKLKEKKLKLIKSISSRSDELKLEKKISEKIVDLVDNPTFAKT